MKNYKECQMMQRSRTYEQAIDLVPQNKLVTFKEAVSESQL